MTPEQLRASILQYAIQGKLVEQHASEGSGEELFLQIQKEKDIFFKVGQQAKMNLSNLRNLMNNQQKT